MNRKIRLICLLIALAFVGVFVISIIYSIALADEAERGGSRGETVYIEADANGTPLNMVSSVYISNPEGEAVITDYTTLDDIKNIAGNEAPVIDGQSVSFESDGEDVCYQGSASGELPFSIEIKYYLDGLLMSPEDIAGAKGRVRVEIKSKNNLLRMTEVDGEAMELYVPFSVISMMTLDSTFSNVTVTGAKLSAQAGQMTVLAVLLPGLAESLEAEDAERIKDSFSIEADTACFELDSMIFIGMTGIVDENDLSGIDDIEGLLSALDDISAASAELYTGSKKLTNALGSVRGGFEEYAAGVSEATAGATEMSEGAQTLYNGALELSSGAYDYARGVNEIVVKLKEAKIELDERISPDAPVDEGTKQIIEEIIAGIIDENAEAFEQALRASLDESLKTVLPDDEERARVIDAIVADVDFSEVDIELSDEQVKRIRNAVIATDEVQALLSQVDTLIDAADKLNNGAGQIAGGTGDISTALKKLSDALKALSEGLTQLDSNSETLIKAIKSITRGSRTLTEGLRALSEEGLETIVSETGKIEVSLSRKDALLALSEEYTSFTCLDSKQGDTVQFMLTTQGIEYDAPIEVAGEPQDGDAAAQASGEPQDSGVKGFFSGVAEWFKKAFDTVKGWFE